MNSTTSPSFQTVYVDQSIGVLVGVAQRIHDRPGEYAMMSIALASAMVNFHGQTMGCHEA